jgi:glycogen operon protein
MSEHTHEVPLPLLPDRDWYLAIDTAAPAPHDILSADKQVVYQHQHYPVAWRSVVVFESRRV